MEPVSSTPGAWSIGFGSGLAMAGDLFRVTGEDTRPWVRPNGTTFMAERFEVTLDEDVLLGAELARDFTSSGRVRGFVHWAEMNGTALANDSQFVLPVLWDRFSLLRLGLVWEQSLAETPLRPYLVGGISFLSFGSTAPELDQTLWTPVLGVGLLMDLNERLTVRMELLDGIGQIDSEALLGNLYPAETDLHEHGPQHIVDWTLGLVWRL